MAYYRRRYRYRRYRLRRPIRRYIRRRFRRFVNGSSKSTIRVKVPLSGAFAFSASKAGTVYNDAICPFSDGSTAASSGFTALNSPLYRQYTLLYDEVKCIGMKAVIALGTPVGTTAVPSVRLVTAWDRRRGYGEAVPSFDELRTSGSSRESVAVNNSIAKIVRSCYASDLMEKAQWHDCTLDTVTLPCHDEAWRAAAANPNFFCPRLFIGGSIGNDTAQTLTFQITVNFYFAFRNPKFGSDSTAAAAIAGVKGVTHMDDDEDGLDGIEPDDPDEMQAVIDEHVAATAAAAAAPADLRMKTASTVRDEAIVASGILDNPPTQSRTAANREAKKKKDRIKAVIVDPPPKN